VSFRLVLQPSFEGPVSGYFSAQMGNLLQDRVKPGAGKFHDRLSEKHPEVGHGSCSFTRVLARTGSVAKRSCE
jgi:hypothetical protein